MRDQESVLLCSVFSFDNIGFRFISSHDIILRSIFLYRLYKGIVLTSKFRRDLWSVKPCIFRKQNTLSVPIVHKCLGPSFTFQNMSHALNGKIFEFQEMYKNVSLGRPIRFNLDSFYVGTKKINSLL